MKSGGSPVFSEPHGTGIVECRNSNFRTDLRRKDAGVRRRLKVPMNSVVFPASSPTHPLTTFFKFPPKKHARLWDSIVHKQEANPAELCITNSYKSHQNEDTIPLVFPPRSIVLILPTLTFGNLDAHSIYIPETSGGRQLKFSKVQVQRKAADPANLQVQVGLNAVNPWFSPTNLLREASTWPCSKQIANNHCEVEGDPPHLDRDYLLSAALRGTRYQYEVPIPNPAHAQHIPFGHQQSPSNFEGIRQTSAVHIQQLPLSVQRFPHLPTPLVQSNTLPTQPAVGQYPTPPGAAAYIKGRVVLCSNCGVHSQHLLFCDRCKKPTTTGRVIQLPDTSPSRPSLSSKQKIGKNDTKEEVVDLSSDENGDSQEKITPGTPSGTVMDYQLLALVSSPQNGKEPVTSDKVTPDEVVKVLTEVTSKSDDSTMFTTVTCSYVRVGTYMVSSGDRTISATIGEIGIYFELPRYKSGETKQIGLPKHQILNLYIYWDSCTSYLKIQTGPKFAHWIRKTLNMDADKNGDCYFCPIDGDESRHQFILMLTDLDENKAAIMKRLYGTDLHYGDCQEEGSVALKREESESNSLVRVVWDGVNAIRAVTACSSTKTSTEEYRHVLHAPMEERKLFHYPYIPQEGDAIMDSCITVHNNDILCLGQEQYLNDQVMDFWMRHILEQLSPEDKERSYFFNTFFYKRLTTKPKSKQQRKTINSFEYDSTLSQAEKRHTRVKGWTKRVDIFKKDFLFIPINENCHWFLVVVCFPGMAVMRKTDVMNKRRNNSIRKLPELDENEDPDRDEAMGDPNEEGDPMETDDVGDETSNPEPARPTTASTTNAKTTTLEAHPCVVVFDSLGPENRCKIYATIRDYLEIEYKTRKAPETRRFDCSQMPGYQPSVPVQPNGCDCGLYVLQYTEAFFRNPIMNFTGVNKMKLRNWFPRSAVTTKRQEMYNFIVDFVKTNFPENAKYIPERGTMVEAGASYH